MKGTDNMHYSVMEEPLTIHRGEVGVNAEANVPVLYFFLMSEHWHNDVVSISDEKAASYFSVTPKTVSRWRNLLVKHGYIEATRVDGNQYDYRLLKVANF